MMKKIDLDFAVSAKPYPAWVRWGLLLLAIVSMLTIFFYYQSLQTALAGFQERDRAQSSQHRPQANRVASVDEIEQARKTQKSLSYPWLALLTRLEAVKQAHKNIAFLNIAPNITKSEMRLEGEAKSFDDITHLLEALKAEEVFTDAALINQYLVEPDALDDNGDEPILTFSLLLKWRLQ